jgi:hypothetical protein
LLPCKLAHSWKNRLCFCKGEQVQLGQFYHFQELFNLYSNWDRCYDFKNIFAESFSKKLAFLTRNKGKLCKILIIKLVFEKNANFFAENCRKSQKIVIITSTPGDACSPKND